MRPATVEQVVGGSGMERVHPDDRELAAQHLHALALGVDDDEPREVRFLGKDGEYRWMVVKGRATVGPDGEVVGFVEKPAQPRSDLANAGMYAFHPDVLDLVDQVSPADIGFDLLPRLVGRSRAVSIGDSYLVDIGTPEALERGRREWGSRYPS